MPRAFDHVLLVDNGSLRAEAVAGLRRIARNLGHRLRRDVEPVSVLHSNAVPSAKLGGRAAEILLPALESRAEAGARSFLIVPLFFGQSRAMTEYVPECAAKLRRRWPALRVRVAAPLVVRGDTRIAELLARLVRSKKTGRFSRRQPVRVALVDHGSPVRAVTRVRSQVAAELRRKLGTTVEAVVACSMERRPGPAYAFNEPLLENLLAEPGWRYGPVIVAQLFLLPGRHAGPDGDIAGICRRSQSRHPAQRIARTGLLGRELALVGILADRVRRA